MFTDQYHVTDHIAHSSLELMLTADQVLVFDWIAGSSQVITLGEKDGVRTKAKIWRKLINPWHIVGFSSDVSLAQSSLGKSLIYCVRNFYNLGKIEHGYSV